MNPLHLPNQTMNSPISPLTEYDGNLVKHESQNQKRGREQQIVRPVFSGSSFTTRASTIPIYKDVAFKKLRIPNSATAQKKDETAVKPPIENIFDQVIVVEVFSSFSGEDNHSTGLTIENEMIGNVESGLSLARRYHPNRRYIWSINPAISQQAIERAHQYGYQGKVFNLAETSLDEDKPLAGSREESENIQPLHLTPRSKLIIVAQGNPQESKIADLEREAFIEMLNEDLGVTQIAELELMVCYMGRDSAYLSEIKFFFETKQSKTCIISYTALLSVSQEGDIIAFNQDDNLIHSIDQVRQRMMTNLKNEKKAMDELDSQGLLGAELT